MDEEKVVNEKEKSEPKTETEEKSEHNYIEKNDESESDGITSNVNFGNVKNIYNIYGNDKKIDDKDFNKVEGVVDKTDVNNSLLEYIIENESLIRMMKLYEEHSYITHEYEQLVDEDVIFLYGRQHIGKFTFAQKILFEKGFHKIKCFNEIQVENIPSVHWKKRECYIIRKIKDIKSFRKIYEKLRYDLKRNHVTIIFLLNEVDYMEVESFVYDLSLKVEMPKDLTKIVKSYAGDRYQKLVDNNPDVEVIESREQLLDIQLTNKTFQSELKSIERMDLLVRLSKLIGNHLFKNQSIMEREELKPFFQKLKSKKAWRETIHEITNIQEKLFLFVINCLGRFPKESIYKKYYMLEEILTKYFSKAELKQIKNNVFWSLSWSERLEKVSANIVNIKMPYYGEEFEVVNFVDEEDKESILNYYLSEFNWFEAIKGWILNCLESYRVYEKGIKRYERDSIITALIRLSFFNYTDIKQTLQEKCKGQKTKAIYVYAYGKLLRVQYDRMSQNDGKVILRNIHDLLVSHKQSKSLLGLKLCRYGFYDISLHKLPDEIIDVSNVHDNMDIKIEAAYCIIRMICYQEESAEKENSIFGALCANDELYKEENSYMVYVLLYFISKNYEVYYSKKEDAYYTYPTIVYIFGKNKFVRHAILTFYQICMRHENLEDSVTASLYKIYEYVNEHNDIPNLKTIWEDFLKRLGDGSQYCKNIISNIEHEIRMDKSNQQK